MSLITPDQFRPGWSQIQVDNRINELADVASEISFSKLTSLYHRFFGVLTGANDGEQIAKPEARNADSTTAKDRFVLNSCVRWQYPAIADGIVAELEADIGYALTERYIISEEVPMLSPTNKFQTRHKGVEAMNVALEWHPLLSDVEVTPFMQTGITGVNMGSGTYAARIDDRLFTNPNDVFLRGDDFRVWPWFSDSTSPLSRNKVDHYWQLPINSRVRSYSPGDLINVQHKRYVIVDIPAQTLPVGAQIYPVYPGSQQIIPQAKEMEIRDEGDTWRFTFWIYTLVHHDFFAETTDLIAGEFWKLYPTIDFKYTTVEEVLPQIVITRGSTVTTLEPTFTLVNPELGIFHVNYDTCWRDWQCLCDDWPGTVTLRYSYKTSPSYLGQKQYDAIGRLRQAAAARIAADLPTFNCNCLVDFGFIAQQQTTYSDSYVSTQTGVVVDKLRYGNMHGQLFYAQVLNNAPKYGRFTEATIMT